MFHNQFIVTAGYEALHQGKAYLDLSARGRIRVTGEDRARLLHALSTNDIKGLKPGEQTYAFFLTAQGRILADAHVYCHEEDFLLDVEPEARETLLKHIEHYIIADDVVLQDLTFQTFALWAGEKNIFGDIAAKSETIARLNLAEATAEDARVFRIEQFHPRFGEDITTNTLPQETGLTRALHFSKGCYIGQEIVERIRSRGHVNKSLVGLAIGGSEIPTAGAKVLYDGADVGEITSGVNSPTYGVRAIAMVRVQAAQPGTSVSVNGAAATVHAVS